MVSIIIPCHNCAGFIHRAVDSALAQTHTDIEIILVENNSTDGTLDVLLQKQLTQPDKIKVYIERKAGAPAARNCGLAHANGKWIQFLDADDELLNDKISTQIMLAEKFNADIVAGASLLRYKTAQKEYEISRGVDKNAWKGLIMSKLGITSSNLWRKEALENVGGWNENQTSSQEYDLLFRMMKAGSTVVADEICRTIVHFSENSVSKSANKEKLERIIRNRINLRLNVKKELQEKGLLNDDLRTALDSYIHEELIANAKKLPELCSEYLKEYTQSTRLRILLKIKTKQYLSNMRNVLSR